MRIYTEVVIDMATMTTEHADFYEHDGPVALCGGSGGGSTTTVDKEYNRRLAAIQERQQDIAEQYFSYWDQYQKPYEIMQTQANTELLPREVEYSKASLDDRISTLGMMQPLKTNFFQQAAEGKDVHSQMAMAQTDVAKGFEDANRSTARAMGRMGVNPSSGQYAGLSAAQDLQKAAAVAGARGQARVATEDENFRRLQQGMQMGMQGG